MESTRLGPFPFDKACPMCGAAANVAWDNLEDKLFGVPGRFRLDRCTSSQCGLVWLDAMPDEAGTTAFYENYYTHEVPPPRDLKSGLKRLAHRIWPIGSQRRLRKEMDDFFLPDAGGKVLELGCGPGHNLVALRDRGWTVVGQELDPAAGETAREKLDLEVVVGPIRTAALPPDTFQAVLMHHVVEHLREPAADLEACRTFLAPAGRLVIITPNIDSFGARLFGRRWRGLEPPRHLFLYNVATMRRRLSDAGFSHVDVFTRGARTEAMARATAETVLPGRPSNRLRYVVARVFGMAVQLLADICRVDRRDRGDELVAIAVK